MIGTLATAAVMAFDMADGQGGGAGRDDLAEQRSVEPLQRGSRAQHTARRIRVRPKQRCELDVTGVAGSSPQFTAPLRMPWLQWIAGRPQWGA